MEGYVYILECNDGTYYTGSTVDLTRRFAEHQSGEGANYTKSRLPVKLVYYQKFQRIDEAFYYEKQIQRWSHRKKTALIRGNYGELMRLSKKKFGRLDTMASPSLDDH